MSVPRCSRRWGGSRPTTRFSPPIVVWQTVRVLHPPEDRRVSILCVHLQPARESTNPLDHGCDLALTDADRQTGEEKPGLHLAECRSGLSPPHDRSEPITARSRALSHPARTPKEPCLSGRAVTPLCSFLLSGLALSGLLPLVVQTTRSSSLSGDNRKNDRRLKVYSAQSSSVQSHRARSNLTGAGQQERGGGCGVCVSHCVYGVRTLYGGLLLESPAHGLPAL